MITGMHTMLYSPDAEAVRAFFRDVLGLAHVDAGHGWIIFKGPPAEMAMPSDGRRRALGPRPDVRRHRATLKDLAAKGVDCAPVREIGWGRASTLRLPDGRDLMICQPLYSTAI